MRSPNLEKFLRLAASHTIPLDDDYLVYQSIPCSMVDKLFNEYMESEEIKDFLDQYSDLREYLERHSGSKMETLADFVFVYDPLNIEYHIWSARREMSNV